MESRELVIYTGREGYDHFTEFMERITLIGLLNHNLSKKSISTKEYENLKLMINSPDTENMEIAKLILLNK